MSDELKNQIALTVTHGAVNSYSELVEKSTQTPMDEWHLQQTDYLLDLIEQRTENRVQRVVRAFTIKGNFPKYHDAQVQQLKNEWPSLYNALRDLAGNGQSYHVDDPEAPWNRGE